MVLIAQPNINEDSQGRQLRVSKKLSKAISAVPRSRFQKPRPNLPGSKRPDTSASTVTHKAIEVHKKESEKNPTVLNTLDESQKDDKSTPVLPDKITHEITQNESEKNSAVLSTSVISQKDDNKGSQVSSTQETFQKKDFKNAVVLDTNEIPQHENDINPVALNTNESEIEGKDVPSTDEKSQKKDDTPVLRTNKKLSKAISSIPRSRFQKPRPNLSNIKRPDPSVSARAQKPVETIQKADDSTKINLNNTLQNADDSNTIILNADEIAKKGDQTDSLISNAIETLKKGDNCSVTVRSDETLKRGDDDNAAVLSSDEISQEKDSGTTPNTSTDGNLQEKVRTISNTSICELLKVKGNRTTSDTNIDESLQKKDSRTTSDTHTNSVSSLLKQNKSNIAANVSPGTTDKSSKYPHLTSILSKKRTEPKKEAQHKRRKKFKKGDAAPERSKMTMADLIYWNPVNTEEQSKKSAESDKSDETLVSINDVEEECIDDIEENHILDSVPKLVLSEDGTINIDQSSLFVQRTIPQPTTVEVVRKDETTYSSFRKRPLTKHWSPKDTAIFYKALTLVGPDFSLMETIFPHRTRRELKQKFKREEKFNIDLINTAIFDSQYTFDEGALKDLIESLNNMPEDSNSENDQEYTTKEKKKSRKQKTTKKAKSNNEINVADECQVDEAANSKEGGKKRKRRAKKSLDSSTTDVGDTTIITSEEKNNNDINGREGNKRKRNAKKLPEDFVSIDVITDLAASDCEEANSNDAFDEQKVENANENHVEDVKNADENYGEGVKNADENHDGVPSASQTSDSTIIEIMDMEGFLKTPLNCKEKNVDNISNIVSQSLSVVNSGEQGEYVTVECIDTSSDLTLFNNVMAYEVVTSQTPVSKRRQKASNLISLRKNQGSFLPQLSPMNYTPV